MFEIMEEKQKEEVTMSVISMKKLLEVGVHFGHQTKRWNQKWLHTFSHQETGFILLIFKNHLKKSMMLIKQMNEIAAKGGKVLFVGTKKTSSRSC